MSIGRFVQTTCAMLVTGFIMFTSPSYLVTRPTLSTSPNGTPWREKTNIIYHRPVTKAPCYTSMPSLAALARNHTILYRPPPFPAARKQVPRGRVLGGKHQIAAAGARPIAWPTASPQPGRWSVRRSVLRTGVRLPTP